MSNVSIYSKNWIDLVFEGKNQMYGAYQLRQENSKTTLLALISGVLFIFTISAIGLLLLSLKNETITTPNVPEGLVITVSNITPPKNNEPKKKTLAAPIKKETVTEKTVKKDPTNFIVVKSTEIHNDVVQNKDLKETSTNGETTSLGTETSIGTGTGIGSASTGTDSGTTNETEIKSTAELDHLPEYPGGMKKFYDYVGTNLEKPETDEYIEGKILTVIVSFVIEKDGSMTEIKVVRSSDIELEKAAIKVLKTLKTKWKPGIINGESVRTRYMLPVKVKY